MASVAKFNTRVQLKFDTFANWKLVEETFKPLKGEVCIVEVPTGSAAVEQTTPPAYLIKVGNGSDYFKNLPWLSALAADVHSWAKKSEEEFLTWVADELQLATNADLEALESRVDALETKVNTTLPGQIDSLGSSLESTGSKTKTITSITYNTETNKATVTYEDIDFPEAEVDTAMSESSTNAVQNKVIKAYVDAVDSKVDALDTKVDNVKTTADAAKQTADTNATTIAQMDFSDPTASASTSTTFIDTISQTDGKITATKKTLPTASDSVAGITKVGGTADTNAATVAQVKAVSSDLDELSNEVDTVSGVANAAKSQADTNAEAIAAMDYNSSSVASAGDGLTFIDSIVQTNGKITSVTKGTVPTANATKAGIVTLGATGGAATHADLTELEGRVTAIEGKTTGAMHFLGTSTTEISDGSTTNTITVGGKSVTVVAGDVVLYGGYEYVWTGSAWEQLGQEGSFAVKGSIKDADIAVNAAIAASKIKATLTGNDTLAEDLTDLGGEINNVATNLTQTTNSLNNHIADKENPHEVTKAQVGLGNVTNDKQVKALTSSTTDRIVVFGGTDGATIKDGGTTIKALQDATTAANTAATNAASAAGQAKNAADAAQEDATQALADAKTANDAIADMDFADPTASTSTSTTFIDTISQTNGKITATKKTLPTANANTAGLVKLGASGGAATYAAVDSLSSNFTTLSNQINGTGGVAEKATNADTLSKANKALIEAMDLAEKTGDGLNFVQTIKQVDGKVTATLGTIQDGTASQKGVVKLGATGGAAKHDDLVGLTNKAWSSTSISSSTASPLNIGGTDISYIIWDCGSSTVNV